MHMIQSMLVRYSIECTAVTNKGNNQLRIYLFILMLSRERNTVLVT